MANKLKNSNLMNFLCQYCGQPLKLDCSFSKLDHQTYNEILGLEGKVLEDVSLDPSAFNNPQNSIVTYQNNKNKTTNNINNNNNVNTSSNNTISTSNISTQLTTTINSTISTDPSTSPTPTTPFTTPTKTSTISSTILSTTLKNNKIEETPQLKIENTYIKAPAQAKLESSLGFVLLGESELHSSEGMSRRMLVTVELFDLLSGNSKIDHPLCQECTDCLLDHLDDELRGTEDEYNAYSRLLEGMMMIHGEKEGKECDERSEDPELDGEIERLEREEEEVGERVRRLEGRQKEMVAKLKKERMVEKELEKKSMTYHKDYNEYKRQLYEYEDAQKSADYQLKYTTKQLSRLKSVNAFNLAFRIWHNGHFGTINGLRLGRLHSMPVDWNEINAAWGQTVLLLSTLAINSKFTFERYKLVPYGNQSRLDSLTEPKKELPLYGVGGFKFFWDTKFDQAMVAFLDCFQQFKEELENLNAECCVPYKMEKGRIEDPTTGISYSIKIQFNSEEQWSKALKLMLTNMKWALVWVASRGLVGGGEVDGGES